MNLTKNLITIVALLLMLSAVCFAGGCVFDDVDEGDWYAEDVQNAYTLGLVAGTDTSLFSPESRITVSQAITMASRANAVYYGKSIDTSYDKMWYEPYVKYAVENGIIASDSFSDYGAQATRAQVASVFYNCLPKEMFEKINDISSVPDVDENDSSYEAVLALYNAGVLTGSDKYGTFRPKDSITRAETAAIINRTLLLENRKKFDVEKYTDDEAYLMCYSERGLNGFKEGISSGWVYDNRGGIPKTGYENDYNALVDISETQGVSLIREFNNTDTGTVVLETSIRFIPSNFNGVGMEYRNGKDDVIYGLYTRDNGFVLETSDGIVRLTSDVHEKANFVFRITVDIDNNISNTVINGEDLGTYGLCTEPENTDIQSFRFVTTDSDMPVASLSNVIITANYGMYEKFDFAANNEMPYGWTGEKAVSYNNELKISADGFASKTFKPVSGIVTANAQFNLTEGQEIEIALKSGAKTVCTFTTDSDAFYFDKKAVYEDYVHNLWYRLRIEADTTEGKAKVWINGRTVGEADIEKTASYVDGIVISNKSDSDVCFDVIDVFERKIQEDYVPVPVKPKGEEEYLIGLNICSLWVNGEHYGWACISAYDDREPVLGYYDEGNPETADWEIKYMVEHGIDFQAFCWYADQSDAPMKKMHLSPHLYDGYMYSRYSNMMDYCLIWEAANASRPKDLAAWNEYYVPYFIENFFKDERYVVIDNELLLSIFGATQLSESVGGPAVVKSMFDSLEEAVREQLGYDGVIFLACGSASDTLAAMGFDGCHAYGWGNTGYKVDVNKSSILRSASNKNMYTVPTASVGFNSIPWHNIRYPLMTTDDYRTVHQWIRDEYLPTYCTKGSWNENFVMLSTWNEYGEGTYIMPCYGNGEFGFLDALREVYTDEKADEELNLIPNEAQKRRINRLYPQHHRILRKSGYYKETVDESNSTVAGGIDYAKDEVTYSRIKDVSVTSEGFYGVTNGDGMVTKLNLAVDTDKVTHLAVTLKGVLNTKCEIFYITDKDTHWTQNKSSSFMIEKSGFNTYYVDMSANTLWNDTVTAIRIDVGQCNTGEGTAEKNGFTLKRCDFIAPEIPSKNMIINGQEFEMQLPYVEGEDTLFFAFDPKVGIDLRLGMFMDWDYKTKTLTIDNGMHNAVYTVGKDICTVDGKTHELDKPVGDLDGLPLIDALWLIDHFEYDVELNEEYELVITTHEEPFFRSQQEAVLGRWEFDAIGNNLGWTSNNMTLFTNGGYMNAATFSQTKDPIIDYDGELNLNASSYSKLTVRCRYKYDSTVKNNMSMYFISSEDTNEFSESRNLRIPLPSTDTKGEWITVSYNLADMSTWKGTITDLRFDPFWTTGWMDIDYIRFE